MSEAEKKMLIKSGLTTRTISIRTGERYAFTRGALEKGLEDAKSGYIPMVEEHLSYLPPFGRLDGGYIEEDDEGHCELFFYAKSLRHGRATELTLPTSINIGDDIDAEELAIKVSLEPRNFRPDDFEELKEGSPFEVDKSVAWSELPPLIIAFSVGLASVGVKDFVQAFCKKIGEASAEGLASWIKKVAGRSKDSNRDALIECRFLLETGLHVLAFLPLDLKNANAIDDLKTYLSHLGAIAKFSNSLSTEEASLVKRIAFLYQKSDWHLCWWTTQDEVFVTPWFEKNRPDPRRFLGHNLPSEGGMLEG